MQNWARCQDPGWDTLVGLYFVRSLVQHFADKLPICTANGEITVPSVIPTSPSSEGLDMVRDSASLRFRGPSLPRA